MPYKGWDDGLYLIKQPGIKTLDLDHYGIMDVGNRLGQSQGAYFRPLVVHLGPPAVRADWLEDLGSAQVLGRIYDEAGAIRRLNEAMQNPNYSAFDNNCEHFARYIAYGKRESIQLQWAVIGVAAVGLILYASRRG